MAGICVYCKGNINGKRVGKYCSPECRTSFNYELKNKRQDESGNKLKADSLTDWEKSAIEKFLLERSQE